MALITPMTYLISTDEFKVESQAEFVSRSCPPTNEQKDSCIKSIDPEKNINKNHFLELMIN